MKSMSTVWTIFAIIFPTSKVYQNHAHHHFYYKVISSEYVVHGMHPKQLLVCGVKYCTKLITTDTRVNSQEGMIPKFSFQIFVFEREIIKRHGPRHWCIM